jgi:hypothetical protein
LRHQNAHPITTAPITTRGTTTLMAIIAPVESPELESPVADAEGEEVPVESDVEVVCPSETVAEVAASMSLL